MKLKRLPLSPTAPGLFWLVAVLALIATAVNYGNNLVFSLAFLLLAIWLQAAWTCYRNLAGLHWQAHAPMPVFAGERLCVEGRLVDRHGRRHAAIALMAGPTAGTPGAIGADGEATLTVALPVKQRGALSVGELALSSAYPLGLWRRRLRLPTVEALVYPAPAGEAPLPAGSPRPAHRQAATDDFQGVRTYAPGDPLRRINWRVFGRREELVVNRFDGGQGGDALWLDWDQCRGDSESRLAQLARWVLEAEHAGREYGLRLPGHSLPQNRGRQQHEKCLTCLALFETASLPSQS
jgi:uncharacterized protein (DUF58 family)